MLEDDLNYIYKSKSDYLNQKSKIFEQMRDQIIAIRTDRDREMEEKELYK